MSAVSIVIPSLGDVELLARCLTPLTLELNVRGAIDEVIVVDDTGSNELAEPLAKRFPRVRVIARSTNGGFARATADGVAAAGRELVATLNSDVIVRPGFLAPLVAALRDERVFAAVPRVLLRGEAERVESLVRLDVERDRVRIGQPCLAERPLAPVVGTRDVAFAIGGACLMRKRDFDELGGFDALFEPFYIEDVDLCWRAWRAGKRVRLAWESTVEHRHRGTIGKLVPPEIVRAAIERNLLLFAWKHASDAELARHLDALEDDAWDAYLGERRDELVAIALALEHAQRAIASRRALGSPAEDLATLARRLDPFDGAPA